MLFRSKILNVCKEISTWDSNKVIGFRRAVKPILDFNYERLKVRHADVVAQKIRELITKKGGENK